MGRNIQHDDTSDEQNVANNINPMFLFNKTGQQQLFNHIDTSTDFNNNPNENKFIKQTNKPSPILSQAPNAFSDRHQQSAKASNAFQHSASYQQIQRKILEEEAEDIFNQNLPLNYFDNSHSNIGTASSLPVDSYFTQNYYNSKPANNRLDSQQQQTNQESSIYWSGRTINQIANPNQQQRSNISNQQQPMSDPVLTQAQLNNKAANYNTTTNNMQNNTKEPQFNNTSNTNNRKISYLLNQQHQKRQQQQQQQMLSSNMIQQVQTNYQNPSQFINNTGSHQHSASMSLPNNAYLNHISYEFTTNQQQQLQHKNSLKQIKLEPQDQKQSAKQFEENDENFSKLKLSSPGSSSTGSNSSPNSSSSSSANLNNPQHQHHPHQQHHHARKVNTNNTEAIDLENIMNSSDLFIGDNDAVMTALNSAATSNSSMQQQTQENLYLNLNSGLISDDQTVVEECLKFANDLEAEEVSKKLTIGGGRVRRRATVSFSKNEDEIGKYSFVSYKEPS